MVLEEDGGKLMSLLKVVLVAVDQDQEQVLKEQLVKDQLEDLVKGLKVVLT